MASATITSNNDDSESCVLCLNKYNRCRPSFCQCKHCSIPLCLDCMKEHHDEMLQNVAQISHQYNELQELIKKKQIMIIDETTKSIEDVNQYFETYINELRATQQNIITNMERAKQDAQDYVRKVDSDLRTLGMEIQGLTKENIVQMTKMKNLSAELKKIEQHLKTYRATRTGYLINSKPDFSIKFDCPPVNEEIPPSAGLEIDKRSPINTNTLSMAHQFTAAVPEFSVNQPQENDRCQDEDDDSWTSDNDVANTQDTHIVTSYVVDRMASDGENVMYTSYYEEESNLIAYCIMDGDRGDADEFRDWKQARIVDMIWWDSIGKFVCGTNDGVYTVDYANGRFKIACVLRGKWSYTRVAANAHQLFVWLNSTENDFNGLEVYSTQFKYIRTIDFNTGRIRSFTDKSFSFCVTENIVASICTRMQNNHKVFQVTFCDMYMKKLNSVLLGECDSGIKIRTDGKDRFFITTGRQHFYIVRSNGHKQKINLQDDGASITVLNNQRIAITSGRADIEVVTY